MGMKAGATIEEAQKETAKLKGDELQTDGTAAEVIDPIEYKATLTKQALQESYKKYMTCSKVAGSDTTKRTACRTDFADNKAARTGIAKPPAAKQNQEFRKAATSDRKEKQAKALKAITEERKSAAACTKATHLCKADDMEIKRQKMIEIEGRALDNTDVKKIEMKAMNTRMSEMRRTCIKERTPPQDCREAMKAEREAMTGEQVDDVEVVRAKKMQMNAIWPITVKRWLPPV